MRLLVSLIVMTVLAASCAAGSGAAPTDAAAAITAASNGAEKTATTLPTAPSSRAADQPTTSPPTTAPLSFPVGIKPVRLEIPAIGVDATIVDLQLTGPEPEVPTDFGDTGWYEQTRLPGEIGPAVIAGHIDSLTGPAVFFEINKLVAGDQIIVHGEDNETRTFEVTDAGQYPKDDLPEEVFGFGGPDPELRLITCGGVFDRSSGHYKDNYVVYTTLVEPEETS